MGPPHEGGRPSTQQDGPPLHQQHDDKPATTPAVAICDSATAGRQESSEPDWLLGLFDEEAARFLRPLLDLDVPLWVGSRGNEKDEVYRPTGWPSITSDGNRERLETFDRHRRPVVCANGGDVFAMVDVDTKNGADVEKVRDLLARLRVRIFAEDRTPSDGVHFWIAGHPDLRTVHSTEKNQKLPDFPGVDIQSHGANVFTPGSRRPKYGGQGYTATLNELAQRALLAEGDDGGTGALVEWVGDQLAKGVKTKARKTPAGAKEWDWEPCEPWNGDPLDKRQQAYLDKAVAGEAEKVAKTVKGGRNDAIFIAALKLGSYVAGAGMDEQKVRDALEGAAEANGYTAEHGVWGTRASISSGLRTGRKNPRAVPPPPPATAVIVDLEGFWELTPTLRHVRDFAYARLVGPWAVLGVALARVVATIPPTVQLPPWVGDNASLNLFVNLVGLSGDGKGAPEKAAKAAFRLGPIYSTGIGSGQGINHLFAHYDTKTKKTVMDRWSVYFSVPEVDTIASETGRTGSNLLPQLRKARDGSDLTFAYVDRAKAVQVLEHSYRLSMVVGVQPGRAGALLNDVDGGTPQRYLWMPADALGQPMEDVEAPEPLDLNPIPGGWPGVGMQGCLVAHAVGEPPVRVLAFPEAARNLIRTNRKRKNRRESTDPELDGHLGLCRMKAAAALALLHGHREVTAEMWEMSAVLMEMSQATRAAVERGLADKERKANLARGKAQGEREVVADEVKDEAAITRVAKGIVRWLGKHGNASYAVVRRDGCAWRDRAFFEAALESLSKAGTVEQVGDEVRLVTA